MRWRVGYGLSNADRFTYKGAFGAAAGCNFSRIGHGDYILGARFGNIYAPVVEMRDQAGRKVLLIGLTHLGPASYFSDIQKRISDWVGVDSRPAVLLQEFFTCSSSVYDSDVKSVSAKSVRALRKHDIDYKPENFLGKTEKELGGLISTFGLKKRACRLDVDGRTKRPPYYVVRNQKWCKDAEASGGSCQWKSLIFQSSPQLKVKQGDIVVDEWPAGMQFVALTMFKGMGVDLDDEVFTPRHYVVLQYRDWNLVKSTMNEFADGAEKIVLPWGASHIAGLVLLLKRSGFEVASIKDVLFISPFMKGKWEFIDKFYDGSDELSEKYDFD